MKRKEKITILKCLWRSFWYVVHEPKFDHKLYRKYEIWYLNGLSRAKTEIIHFTRRIKKRERDERSR